jgi:predicted transcriptional regulator
MRDNNAIPEVLTIRIDRKTRTRREKLAKAMDHSKSGLAA